jgi:hypothetical protein
MQCFFRIAWPILGSKAPDHPGITSRALVSPKEASLLSKFSVHSAVQEIYKPHFGAQISFISRPGLF